MCHRILDNMQSPSSFLESNNNFKQIFTAFKFLIRCSEIVNRVVLGLLHPFYRWSLVCQTNSHCTICSQHTLTEMLSNFIRHHRENLGFSLIVTLNSVLRLSTVLMFMYTRELLLNVYCNGPWGIRTPSLLLAKQAIYRWSKGPWPKGIL